MLFKGGNACDEFKKSIFFYNAWSLKTMSLKCYVEIRNGTIVNM